MYGQPLHEVPGIQDLVVKFRALPYTRMARPNQADQGTEPRGNRRVGLARTLSKLGYCSRSQAVALIQSGAVSVNGIVRRDPEYPIRQNDRITSRGEPVAKASKVYFVLNKPRGVVTTASDEKGRETVYSVLPRDLPWLAPVGRLDKASEGLLLLTNDSEWAGRITDPVSHLEKIYHVQVTAIPAEELLERLRRGILSDGELLKARSVSILRSGEKNSWLEFVLDEGRNRQIRRMLAAFDIDVLRLIRVAIGPLALGTLPKGQARTLTKDEREALDRALSLVRK